VFEQENLMDVAVVGAGPAGLVAALRASELGARTVLVTRGEVGGMAANDGPIPVRALARAARLLREARQLEKFGISVSAPILVYPRLLERMREVVHDVCEQALRREDLNAAGVTIYEQSGTAHFVDAHTLETESGLRLQADKIILSAGGTSRRLPVPASSAPAPTATHGA
jgi:pyruvate/2-oxoglutarate dehydrogenase complex dihydrolipoamide dehydrogenase (E3) component